MLANGNAVPPLDQTADIASCGFDREPGKWNVGRGSVVAACECEAQFARCQLGIIEKHLIKITHAKKENRIGVLRLYFPVLADQRRVRR